MRIFSHISALEVLGPQRSADPKEELPLKVRSAKTSNKMRLSVPTGLIDLTLKVQYPSGVLLGRQHPLTPLLAGR